MPRGSKTKDATVTQLHGAILLAVVIECHHGIPPTREIINEHTRLLIKSKAHLEKLLLELVNWKPEPLLLSAPDVYRPHQKGRVPNIYLFPPSLLVFPYCAQAVIYTHGHFTQFGHAIAADQLRQLLEQQHSLPTEIANFAIDDARSRGYIILMDNPLTLAFNGYVPSPKAAPQLLYLAMLASLDPRRLLPENELPSPAPS